MDTSLPQKFPFILDSNLAKANCTEDRVCTSCDKVVLGQSTKIKLFSAQATVTHSPAILAHALLSKAKHMIAINFLFDACFLILHVILIYHK